MFNRNEKKRGEREKKEKGKLDNYLTYPLAQFWGELQADLSKCEVSDEGRRWVDSERIIRAPEILLKLLAPFDTNALNQSIEHRK